MNCSELSLKNSSVKYDDKTGMFAFGFAVTDSSPIETPPSICSSHVDSKSCEKDNRESLDDESAKGNEIENRIKNKDSCKLNDDDSQFTKLTASDNQKSIEKMDVSQKSIEIITPCDRNCLLRNQNEKDKDSITSPENKKRKLNDGRTELKADSQSHTPELSHSKIFKRTNHPQKKNSADEKDIPVIYISSDSEPNQIRDVEKKTVQNYDDVMLNAQRVESEMYRMGQGPVRNNWLVNYHKGNQEIVYLSDDTETEEDIYEEQVKR